MKNLVIVSFPAKEGMMNDLKEMLKNALPDTRSFDGCISVDTYIEGIHFINFKDPHLVIKKIIRSSNFK